MTGIEIALGIVLIVMAVFLVIAIMMQSGKDNKLSGTIAGGAETFFSKSNATTIDKVLNRATIVVAALFALIVIVMYVLI